MEREAGRVSSIRSNGHEVGTAGENKSSSPSISLGEVWSPQERKNTFLGWEDAGLRLVAGVEVLEGA